MHKSTKGFTLAEVLVTLAIIGVVAALTIPTLISNTSKQRYTVALKKQVAVLNESLQTTIAELAVDAKDPGITDATTLANLFIYGSPAGKIEGRNPSLNVAERKDGVVTLADGTRLQFVKGTSGTNPCNEPGSALLFTEPGSFNIASNCYVVVDVNGVASPNQVSTDTNLRDIYVLGVTSNLVEPISMVGGTITYDHDSSATTPSVTILSGNSASSAVMTGKDK